MRETDDFTAANRAAWDASAAAHEAAEDWAALWRDVARPGFTVLDPTMTRILQAVGTQGARCVQIGCNNGRELLSLPSLGLVPALGIDQSEAFLDQARRLAARAGSDCAFLAADIYHLPEDVPRDFDLAMITIGVLNWMPDLERFFRIVAGLMASGAHLVIYETHPFLEMVEPEAEDPFALSHSYFRNTPFVEDAVLTYDGSDAGIGARSYWFMHRMGEIVTACASAGLVIRSLEEYPHCNREVVYEPYERRQAQLPLCYSLVACKA